MSPEILSLIDKAGLTIQNKNGEDLICNKEGIPFWDTFHKSEEYILGFLNGMIVQKENLIK